MRGLIEEIKQWAIIILVLLLLVGLIAVGCFGAYVRYRAYWNLAFGN
jgi:hypothetical protein